MTQGTFQQSSACRLCGRHRDEHLGPMMWCSEAARQAWLNPARPKADQHDATAPMCDCSHCEVGGRIDTCAAETAPQGAPTCQACGDTIDREGLCSCADSPKRQVVQGAPRDKHTCYQDPKTYCDECALQQGDD